MCGFRSFPRNPIVYQSALPVGCITVQSVGKGESHVGFFTSHSRGDVIRTYLPVCMGSLARGRLEIVSFGPLTDPPDLSGCSIEKKPDRIASVTIVYRVKQPLLLPSIVSRTSFAEMRRPFGLQRKIPSKAGSSFRAFKEYFPQLRRKKISTDTSYLVIHRISVILTFFWETGTLTHYPRYRCEHSRHFFYSMSSFES